MSNYIRDGRNNVVGYIKEMGSVTYAHGSKGENVGYFSKSANATFDKNGKRYGTGDLTSALVMNNSKNNR